MNLNIKKLAVGVGLTFGLAGMAMAEDPAPRVPSYGSVMQSNAAVDFTVADYLVRPHLINELQYVTGYTGSAGFIDAAFSFNGAGINWFGGMENNPRTAALLGSTNVSRIKAGLAIGSAFGAGLLYEFNKISTSDNSGATPDVSTTNAGDAYGAFGSMGLGSISIFAEVSRVTGPAASVTTETDALTDEDKNTSTNIIVGAVKDTEGEGSHALAATLSLALFSQEFENPTANQSAMNIGLNINHGVPLKYNDQMAVFVGSIINLGYSSSTNEVPDPDAESSGYLFSLAPNMSFQKVLGKGFEISMGGSVNMLTYASGTTDPGENTTSGLETGFNGPSTGDLSFGLRWAKENFAIEGELSKALILNGPDFIGGTGPGVLGSGGVSLSF